jgi:hypothetical protein
VFSLTPVFSLWLAQEDAAKKRMGFETMCRGWAKGSDGFRKAVLDDLKDETVRRVAEAEAAEMREPRWERATEAMLSELGRKEEDLANSPKGIAWKVAIARLLRERYLAPNRWIAERLNMGQVSTVQSLVSRHRTGRVQPDGSWRKLKNHETLGWCFSSYLTSS